MHTCIRLLVNSTEQQKQVWSHLQGYTGFIWNARRVEYCYHSTCTGKYCPVGTFAPVNQMAAQFKSKELTPQLSDFPGQIIRSSATGWYQSCQKFIKGQFGRPKNHKGSFYLICKLFWLLVCTGVVSRLIIGIQTSNIGYLSFKSHRFLNELQSLRRLLSIGSPPLMSFGSFSREQFTTLANNCFTQEV